MAISKFDRVEFANLVDSYLPGIKFDFEDPYDYTETFIKATPIPSSVFAGVDDIEAWRIYASKFQLLDLHAAFNKEEFEDIIFDTDIRRKINAMSLSNSFRKNDIIREFASIDAKYIGVYLDSFADFSKIENLNSYVAKYISDVSDLNLFKKMLTVTSRMHLKALLGIKVSTDPKAIIEKSLNVIDIKADLALVDDDDDKLKDWVKLRINIAEKLLKMGAGNKTDLDNLLEALSAEPNFEDPVIYTKEQLEIKFKESSND